MNDRIRNIVDYVAARLGESSTWQGIGFCLTLGGAKWAANLDWGQAAGLGGMASALLKIAFPDPAH